MKKHFEEIMIGITIFVALAVTGAGTFVGYKIYDSGKNSVAAEDEEEEEDDDELLAVSDDSVTVSGSATAAKKNRRIFIRDTEMQNDTSLDDIELPSVTPSVIYAPTAPPYIKRTPAKTKTPKKTEEPEETERPTKKPSATKRTQVTPAPEQEITEPQPTEVPQVTDVPKEPEENTDTGAGGEDE